MWYLQSAFDAYHKVQESVGTRLGDVQSAALAPLGIVRNLFAPQGAAEADELRRRVAELESQLAAPRQRTTAKRPRAKPKARG